MSGNILKYLHDRNHRIVVNGDMSSEKGLGAGVPQGSVLGPLLFHLFINDIADELFGMDRLFADLLIFESGRN